MNELIVDDLGLVPYEEAHRRQREWVERKKGGHSLPDRLLLLEHPPVYTQGRRGQSDCAGLIPVERGGEATFHNPGQLVAYPILTLEGAERDLHLHLRRLESAIIDCLHYFGLDGQRRPGATGVWIKGKEKKIASIGVAVSGWITYHGMALNVENDLVGFSRIQPCGFKPQVMTSILVENGASPGLPAVKKAFVRAFLKHFRRVPSQSLVAGGDSSILEESYGEEGTTSGDRQAAT